MFGSKTFLAIPLVTMLGMPGAEDPATNLTLISDLHGTTIDAAAQALEVEETLYQLRIDAEHSLALAAAAELSHENTPIVEGGSDRSLSLASAASSAHAIEPHFEDEPNSASLKTLIASAEAGLLGYDAVQYGARQLPPKRPTEMTLGQILDWAQATPGQHHAIGRYQIIPSTMRDLMRRGDIPRTARFSREMQDDLADILLADAGLDKFADGDISRAQFMNNLARIWAGLPTDTGRSAYHGYAGNQATISWPDYDQRMAAIFR